MGINWKLGAILMNCVIMKHEYNHFDIIGRHPSKIIQLKNITFQQLYLSVEPYEVRKNKNMNVE